MNDWISVGSGVIDDTVLVSYLNKYNKRETDQAFYANENEILAGELWGSEDMGHSCIYDCITNDGYVKEGWYTSSYSAKVSYPIDGTVTHWMSLPKKD